MFDKPTEIAKLCRKNGFRKFGVGKKGGLWYNVQNALHLALLNEWRAKARKAVV